MKLSIRLAWALGTMTLLSSCATQQHEAEPDVPATYPATTSGVAWANAPDTVEAGWPMTFNDGTTSYTIYEPQCDSWDGHRLEARSALAVQPAGQTEPVYGVIAFNAITLVDKATHTVTLADFKLVSADFPSARNQTQNYLVPILIRYAKNPAPLALDRLESSLALAKPPPTGQLDNTPPKIISSTRPAVLVNVDGPPAWRPVAGTGLERLINTRMLLLRTSSGVCYLHLFDGYLQAPALSGPWKPASQAPPGAGAAEKLALDSGEVDLMSGIPDPATGKKPSLRMLPVPDIYVTSTPGELIQFHGPPEFASIPGTDLLYVVNTTGNVFRLLTDQQIYLLISGRWYRAPALNGPWQFVPGTRLPHDFENIPDTSPKENVKASVPGTPQAEAALIANSIPQSTAVARNGQMPEPPMDGSMQLEPIAGTPLQAVANSATPIIEVNPTDWYACQNGVWYAASSGNGPWTVATSIPPVIYTIPPSSPLHYVTYVQVYGATADQVYEGYTPGYLGTEVGADGTVVYGTGYDYNPWLGSAWYGPPVTWGWGFDNCWTPACGWGFGCGFGWGWGYGGFGAFACYPPRPCWGGYQGYQGWRNEPGGPWGNSGYRDFANTGANLYHPDGQLGGNRFNGLSRPGSLNAYGQTYNSRLGQFAPGTRTLGQNVPGGAGNSSRWAGSSPNGVNAFNRNSSANGYAYSSPNRPMNSSGYRSWSFPSQQWPAQSRGFTAPGFNSLNQPNYNRGGMGGNNSMAAPRSGGWMHSMGSFFGRAAGFHGGGGGRGGGSHGGGGGGHGR